jgi:hypothetical protein
MAKILEFPLKITLAGAENVIPRVKNQETLAVAERLMGEISQEIPAEGTPAWSDVEALKDIYSIFSTINRDIIELLSDAGEKGLIDKREEVILFALYKIYSEDNFEEIIKSVTGGSAVEEALVRFPEKPRNYLSRINQRIENLKREVLK